MPPIVSSGSAVGTVIWSTISSGPVPIIATNLVPPPSTAPSTGLVSTASPPLSSVAIIAIAGSPSRFGHALVPSSIAILVVLQDSTEVRSVRVPAELGDPFRIYSPRDQGLDDFRSEIGQERANELSIANRDDLAGAHDSRHECRMSRREVEPARLRLDRAHPERSVEHGDEVE